MEGREQKLPPEEAAEGFETHRTYGHTKGLEKEPETHIQRSLPKRKGTKAKRAPGVCTYSTDL